MGLRDYYEGHRTPVLAIAGSIAALAIVGWAMRGRPDPQQYATARVEQGTITSAVQATGTINPLTTVPVGSYVSGTVKYIFADFNTHVESGQVLALIDPQVYSLKAAADYARVNARRTLDLAARGILPRDQADLSQSGLDQADAQLRAGDAQLNQSVAQLAQLRAQLDQARAQVRAAQGALDLAETNLKFCTITSPIDGTVVARNVTVGQSVAASLQAPVVFSIAQDLTRMQLYAATDESDTGNIKIGTEATFQVDAFPTETFRGRVSAIRLNATTVQNVVTYNTVIDFENPDGRLLPGETAYATIPTGEVANVVKIPNAAIRFTPNLSTDTLKQLYRQYDVPPSATSSHAGGSQVVWMVEAGGKLRPVALRVGLTDYTFTQLVSGDVRLGDALVTGEAVGGENSAIAPPRFGGPRR